MTEIRRQTDKQREEALEGWRVYASSALDGLLSGRKNIMHEVDVSGLCELVGEIADKMLSEEKKRNFI